MLQVHDYVLFLKVVNLITYEDYQNKLILQDDHKEEDSKIYITLYYIISIERKN